MNAKQNKKTKAILAKCITKMIFTGKNYMILGIAILLLTIGFGGMYIENNLTGWFSLYISPVLAVAGFITVAVAILYRENKNSQQV